MTKKAKEFARLVSGGMAPADAYRRAYERPDCDRVAASKYASRLMKNDEISRRIAVIDEKMDRRAIMSKQERMEWLSQRVREAGEEEVCPAVVANGIRAIAELNKMDGAYEPERVEARVEAMAFSAIMERVVNGGG